MKKLLALLLLFGIVGCSEPIAPPEEIAASYYHNLMKGNAEEAYMFLSAEDKAESSIDDLKSSVFFNSGDDLDISINDLESEDDLGFMKLLMNLSNVDVVNVTTNNNNSIVELSANVIDIEVVSSKILEKLFADFPSSDNEDDESDSDNSFTESFNELEKSELPRLIIKGIKVKLNKEDSGWAVYVDLNKLKNERNEKLLLEKQEEERFAEEKRIEEEQLAENKRIQAENEEKIAKALQLADKKFEKEELERIAAEKEAYRDLTINVALNRDEFTDKPSSIQMIFASIQDDSSYRPKSIALVRYIDAQYAIIILNQSYSIDDYAMVQFRFDNNSMFTSRFQRTDDNVFNIDKWFFYKFLRKLENTSHLLVKVSGESSFKTEEYFKLEAKYKKFLCLIDEHDSEGVDESQLKLFPTKYYEYNKADCDI